MNKPIDQWTPGEWRLFLCYIILSAVAGIWLGIQVGEWSYEFIKAHGGLAVMLAGWCSWF